MFFIYSHLAKGEKNYEKSKLNKDLKFYEISHRNGGKNGNV